MGKVSCLYQKVHTKPLFWSYAALLCSFLLIQIAHKFFQKLQYWLKVLQSLIVLTNFMNKKIFIDTTITLTASILTLLHSEIINLAIRRQKKKYFRLSFPFVKNDTLKQSKIKTIHISDKFTVSRAKSTNFNSSITATISDKVLSRRKSHVLV